MGGTFLLFEVLEEGSLGLNVFLAKPSGCSSPRVHRQTVGLNSPKPDQLFNC